MSLSLSCSCGAGFEVEETFAGQVVSCPECQRPVQAPSLHAPMARTSALAIASMVLALMLAFTFFGTILAVVLGIVALGNIGRNPGKLTGSGYALFGILAGAAFTGLFFLAVSHAELFSIDGIRRQVIDAGNVDLSGPLELKCGSFTITRPTMAWGIARQEMLSQVSPGSNLLLVHLARQSYIDVTHEQLDGQDLETHLENVIAHYRWRSSQSRSPGCSIRHKRLMPARNGMEQAELLLDLNEDGQPVTYLIRLARPLAADSVYQVRGWAKKVRFALAEKEIKQAQDSFRTSN